MELRFSPGCADDHQGSTNCQVLEGQALRKRSCKNQTEVQWLSIDKWIHWVELETHVTTIRKNVMVRGKACNP